MKILIIIVILFSSADHEVIHEIRLAMPHTHHIENVEKIEQMSRKYLQL